MTSNTLILLASSPSTVLVVILGPLLIAGLVYFYRRSRKSIKVAFTKSSELPAGITEYMEAERAGIDPEDFKKMLEECENKGIDLSASYLIKLKRDGISPWTFIEAVEINKNAGEPLKREELRKYAKLKNRDMVAFIRHIIKMHELGLKINFDLWLKKDPPTESLEPLYRAAASAVSSGVMHIGELSKIPDNYELSDSSHYFITWPQLFQSFAENINLDELVKALLKAKILKLEVLTADFLIRLKLAEIEIPEFVDTLVVLYNVGLGNKFSTQYLIDFKKTGGDFGDFRSAVIYAKEFNIDVTNEELSEFHLTGGKIGDYVKSINLSRSMPEITRELIREWAARKAEIVKCVNAVSLAKKNNIPLSFFFAATLSSMKIDIAQMMQDTLNPKAKPVKEFVAQTRNGVQLRINVSALVIYQIMKHFNGSEFDVLEDRITSAIVRTLAEVQSHESAFDEKKEIAAKAMALLQAETELNGQSRYELTDLNIISMTIEDDEIGKFHLHHAKHKAEEDRARAEADKIKGEALVEQALARSIENGHARMSDYNLRNLNKRIKSDEEKFNQPPPPPPNDDNHAGGQNDNHH